MKGKHAEHAHISCVDKQGRTCSRQNTTVICLVEKFLTTARTHLFLRKSEKLGEMTTSRSSCLTQFWSLTLNTHARLAWVIFCCVQNSTIAFCPGAITHLVVLVAPK